MKTVRSRIILLHQYPYSESSKILKVFCRTSGLLSFIAKGAERPKSKFRGLLHSFNLLEAVYTPTHADKLILLQDAALLQPLHSIQGDLNKQAIAHLWLEIYLRHLFGSDACIPLYELLESSLIHLDNSPAADVRHLSDFLLHFFALMGFRPQFEHCVHCGKQVRQFRIIFDLAMGGPACRKCEAQSPHFIKMQLKQLQWLTHLQHFGTYRHAPHPGSLQQSENMLLQFLYHQTHRSGSLKSLSFYQNMLHLPHAETRTV